SRDLAEEQRTDDPTFHLSMVDDRHVWGHRLLARLDQRDRRHGRYYPGSLRVLAVLGYPHPTPDARRDARADFLPLHRPAADHHVFRLPDPWHCGAPFRGANVVIPARRLAGTTARHGHRRGQRLSGLRLDLV